MNVDRSHDAVFVKSEPIADETPTINGYDFVDGMVDYSKLLQSYLTTGFQATNMALAITVI